MFTIDIFFIFSLKLQVLPFVKEVHLELGQIPKRDFFENCPITEFFLVRISPHSNWISYLSIFSPNAGKYGPDKTTYLDTFQAVKLLTIFAKTSNSPWRFTVIWIPQRNSSRWTSIERTWDIHMTGNFFKIWKVKPFHPVTAKTWERKKLVSKPSSGISLGNLVYLLSYLVIALQRKRHRKLFTSF